MVGQEADRIDRRRETQDLRRGQEVFSLESGVFSPESKIGGL